MRLHLVRDELQERCTIGLMSIEQDFECFTLEDAVREIKIPGETAIPYGEYEVVVSFSNRFKKMMPLLLNVPGFEGVRIHSGNTDADTSGCIIVGQTRHEKSIGASRAAFDILFPKIQEALKVEKVWINIVSGEVT